MRDAELKIEAERWCHCSTTRYQIENTNTCRIDVLKDTREREREREFTVDEIKKKEEDEMKQEKQVKKERGEIKIINCMDVKTAEKKKIEKERSRR